MFAISKEIKTEVLFRASLWNLKIYLCECENISACFFSYLNFKQISYLLFSYWVSL